MLSDADPLGVRTEWDAQNLAYLRLLNTIYVPFSCSMQVIMARMRTWRLGYTRSRRKWLRTLRTILLTSRLKLTNCEASWWCTLRDSGSPRRQLPSPCDIAQLVDMCGCIACCAETITVMCVFAVATISGMLPARFLLP